MIYKVWYTDKFVAKRFAGQVWGPLIFIRPKYKGDRGLLEHEKQHVRQFWKMWCVGYWILYNLSKKWRLKLEVEGYKVQLEFSPGYKRTYAHYLSTLYNLDITTEEALLLLGWSG